MVNSATFVAILGVLIVFVNFTTFYRNVLKMSGLENIDWNFGTRIKWLGSGSAVIECTLDGFCRCSRVTSKSRWARKKEG